ncbi:MAG: hypothetical protein WB791_05100 [Waddliaceae bacterium]
MPLSSFQKQLEKDLKQRVSLTINNNRTTMLSVKWEPSCTKVSLHRFFLFAPKNIMDALARYIKRKDRSVSPIVKSFMEDHMRQLDYSHLLDRRSLEVKGRIYDLQELLCKVNEEYFHSQLPLNITWFGKHQHNNRSQVTFGLYQHALKLIKIHRLLDHPEVPEYLVSFVIYHESLHHLYPSYYDQKGRHCIHHQKFKAKEKEFRDYRRAQAWVENNREQLFRQQRDNKRRIYGWS